MWYNDPESHFFHSTSFFLRVCLLNTPALSVRHCVTHRGSKTRCTPTATDTDFKNNTVTKCESSWLNWGLFFGASLPSKLKVRIWKLWNYLDFYVHSNFFFFFTVSHSSLLQVVSFIIMSFIKKIHETSSFCLMSFYVYIYMPTG